MSMEIGEGQLRADAARHARSLPTAPAPSPRPVACQAASVFSGPPSLRLDSFGEMILAGSSPRLAVHRGSSHNSRPPRRGAPHRWRTLRLLASNPTVARLSFLFLFPSFFSLCWQIWVSFLALFFLSFFFLLPREESGGGGVAWRAFKNVLVRWLEFCGGGNSSARAVAVAARAAVRCWLSLDKRPSVPGLLAQSAAPARLSPAPAARSLLLAVG